MRLVAVEDCRAGLGGTRLLRTVRRHEATSSTIESGQADRVELNKDVGLICRTNRWRTVVVEDTVGLLRHENQAN